MLRTALLPRELLNKSRHAVRIGIGNVIDVARVASTADDAALASQLRLQTYSLVEKVAAPPRVSPPEPRPVRPVAAAQPADLLAAEVARLPAHQRLAGAGDLSAYVASARLAPRVLQEIGRLRELTFRAVGEGTGKSADIDLFDDYYQHLFLWHEGKKEIAGAYRLGATDRIIRKLGVRGFYTNTLFGFRKTFIDRVDPGLELGRSFVRAEYQKSFAPLLLLWKGIAEYVVRNPRYAVLFGAVSISNDYRPLSRDFLVNFLSREHFDPSLGRLIKARHPVDRSLSLKSLIDPWPGPHNLEALAALVSGLEPDGKGVPVLLRQYLKLGGKIVSFNVDPDFSDSIDCCIVVDLRKTDPLVLEKYMGKAGAAAFLSEHCLGSVTQQVS
jgi:putative hemolysin